jgi:hypothetical protein
MQSESELSCSDSCNVDLLRNCVGRFIFTTFTPRTYKAVAVLGNVKEWSGLKGLRIRSSGELL